MTRRSQFAPSRVRSSSVRRGAGARVPRDPTRSMALLPTLPGSRHPAECLVTPPWPLPRPQRVLEVRVASP